MEEKKVKYPIGVQDFEKLITFGYVYTDKTDLIYELVNGGNCIFLSRPRRFGKSLLLSTIRYYFEGRKDLFEGLKIMDLEKEWTRHPVINLELSRIGPNDPNSLSSSLKDQFSIWEEKLDLTPDDYSFPQRFARIIRKASEVSGQRVVILIDEYDNPLINTIHRPEIYEANRALLKSVYSNLKPMDEYIRFAMLTGVGRFSNTTVFSGLNNLQDITFSNRFCSICGFTLDEIRDYMWPGVEELARNEDCTPEEALGILKSRYDGYHFSKKRIDIYNPFSLLNCLSNSDIQNYWIQSGVPEFLAKKLQENGISFRKLFTAEADTKDLSVVDAAFDDPVALFYQTGYLTIKGYDAEENMFRLGIPNKEVNEGLFHFLLGKYTPAPSRESQRELNKMARCLEEGKAGEFVERLQALLAPVGYHLQGKMTEVDFERTMYVIFHVLGFHVHSELSTSRGRIDLTVETKDYVYVIELKLDRSAEEALAQIESKDYALPWKFDGRRLYKIGISFNSETRNIDDWIIT